MTTMRSVSKSRPSRRVSRMRKAFALASRRVGKALIPQPGLERVRAKVLADHHHRTAVGLERGSQVSRSSCSAALPIRIGGFDQISSYVAAGRSRPGRRGEPVGEPERRRVLVGQQHRPFVDVDPGDDRIRDRGDRQPDHAVATAEVEDPAPGWRGGLAEEDRRPDVEPAPAVDPRPADQRKPRPQTSQMNGSRGTAPTGLRRSSARSRDRTRGASDARCASCSSAG